MRNHLASTAFGALGVALVAGTSAATAQTVITRDISDQAVETVITQQPGAMVIAQAPLVPPAAVVPGPPATVVTQAPTTVVTEPVAAAPVATVETVRTVRSTTVPRHRLASRHFAPHRTARVTTTRTIVRESAVPVTPAVAAVTQPTYTEVVTAPVVSASTYPAPLYDAVTAPAVVPPAAVAQPVVGGTIAAPAYRYVYEPDRILVIDPYTDIAVQSIPR